MSWLLILDLETGRGIVMIITVTLNPAVDEEYVVPEFRPGGWFRASETNRSAGGKGVNVSLILSQLGYSSAAMGFLAGFNGEFIRDELRKKRITTNFVHVRGETRTNVYIVDEIGHVETGVTESGPYVSEGALGRFLNNYDRMLTRAKFVYMGDRFLLESHRIYIENLYLELRTKELLHWLTLLVLP